MEFILVQSIDVFLHHGVEMFVATFRDKTRTENAEITLRVSLVVIDQNRLHFRVDKKECVQPEMTQFLLEAIGNHGYALSLVVISYVRVCHVWSCWERFRWEYLLPRVFDIADWLVEWSVYARHSGLNTFLEDLDARLSWRVPAVSRMIDTVYDDQRNWRYRTDLDAGRALVEREAGKQPLTWIQYGILFVGDE